MESFTIRQLIDLVSQGQIRIPTFQRGFVWDTEMVAFFMDSIYKGYPFGNLLFWRTKQPLRVEKSLGPYPLPERDPDYPVDYVLDGQQRITSIFGVFQTEIEEDEPVDWSKIYFNYIADQDAQESQFLALDASDADPDVFFPLKALFNVVEYRKATEDLSIEVVQKIDELQARFKEARFPVQIIQTEDRATVAIVFERVNQRGVPLDTLQLLTAWTWSEEFDLHEKFKELAQDLKPFGFEEVGKDADLLLRCCAGILMNDPSPEALVNLSGAEVRARFDEFRNGIKGAIDFLINNLNVATLSNLPLPTAIIPLSVYFTGPEGGQIKITSEHRNTILMWFWRTCFAKRYSSGVLRNLRTDIAEMVKLKEGKPSQLGQFGINVRPGYFIRNIFRMGSVNTKTFILMLAQMQPCSFISGNPLTLRAVLREYNRREFHHVFPKSYLKKHVKVPAPFTDSLANFCFLSRADNNQLGGVSPREYRYKMAKDVDNIISHALLPPDVFDMGYSEFLNSRSAILATNVNELCGERIKYSWDQKTKGWITETY